MNLTERHLSILQFIATYYTATRAMIQAECLPETGKDGCVARKLLNQLFHNKLINKTKLLVCNPEKGGSPAPVYYPSFLGCETLSVETGDDSWLNTCTNRPNWQFLPHWLDIARFHIVLDKAIAQQKFRYAEVLSFLHEADVANPNEKDPDKHYKLFTEIRKQPRLVCAPDAAFLLSVAQSKFRKAMYLEIDRSTSGIRQIANSKSPGYAGMGSRHNNHFPETNVESFSVLLVTHSEKRRDALQRAIREKPGAHLWKFVAWTDITPDSLLYEPILRDSEGNSLPMIRPPQGGKR